MSNPAQYEIIVRIGNRSPILYVMSTNSPDRVKRRLQELRAQYGRRALITATPVSGFKVATPKPVPFYAK